MVDQEISQHRAAEGPADERCHHRVSQGRAPLSQTESAKDSGHYRIHLIEDDTGEIDARLKMRTVTLTHPRHRPRLSTAPISRWTTSRPRWQKLGSRAFRAWRRDRKF